MTVSKRLSVILISEETSRPRRFRIHKSLPAIALGLALVFSGLFGFLAYSYYQFNIDQDELFRLRNENSHQRQELQRLAVDLDFLHQELAQLVTTEARVRQLASLDTPPPGLPIAVGGLSEDEETQKDDVLQQQINKLQVEIELRRQSQENVRNLLNDQVSLSRATPSGWPTKGWLTSYFGKRKSPFTGRMVMHEGLDIAANTGTPVIATADGVVAKVGYSPGYGKIVVVDHGYGYRTIFGHNSKILAKPGQRVSRGDKIALVGNTGRSTGPHLHYELLLNGVPIDPRKTL